MHNTKGTTAQFTLNKALMWHSFYVSTSSTLFTHQVSAWVSWGSWNDSLLYTMDRWVHCGEFAGDKIGMPVCTRLC